MLGFSCLCTCRVALTGAHSSFFVYFVRESGFFLDSPPVTAWPPVVYTFVPPTKQGCVVIFLSNFLALLIKVDEAGPGRRDTLGGLLVAVNLMLVVAVIATSWFATQQSVEDSRDEEGNPFAVAKTMMTAERLAANDAQQHSREVRIYPAGPRSVDRLSTVSGQSGLGSGGVTSAGGSSKVGSRAPFRRSGGDESIESMSAVPPARSVGGSIPVSGGGSRGFSGGFWGKARRQSIETLWREDKERGKS